MKDIKMSSRNLGKLAGRYLFLEPRVLTNAVHVDDGVCQTLEIQPLHGLQRNRGWGF